MTLRRPPLMSQGQANDFYSYMTIATGLMWLAGGLAAGPTAVALGLCGAGAIANNSRGSGRKGNDPEMVYAPPQQTEPPGPLQHPKWEQWAYDALHERERTLEREFGINAVYCYRSMILNDGYKIKAGYDVLYPLLDHLREHGYWDKGQIQSGDMTPKQVLDYVTGRRVASPELQRWFHPNYFPKFYEIMEEGYAQKGLPPGVAKRALIDLSMMIYILGLQPISDKPVRRMKWWVDRTPRQPLYYVADWEWFTAGPFQNFRDRWDTLFYQSLRNKNGMPQHLLDEVEDLFQYRVEVHQDTAPPGYPDEWRGKIKWSHVLFGRERGYPATAEDMQGMP